MKKLATLLAAGLLIGSAFASTTTPKKMANGGRHWVLNVGLGIPTDDHEDLGVDTLFMASFDYHFGQTGNMDSNTSWFAGIGGAWGEGDADLTSQTFGAHVGILFGFGQPGEDNPWGIELKGGFYRTELSNGSSSDETGFGGSLALVYTPRSSTGTNIRFAAGWYMFPEVDDVDNRGWFFSIGFPFGGS